MNIPTLRSFLLVSWIAATLGAQGSQQPLGGGCANRTPPSVSGALAIGTPLQIDDPGCFTGQGGFGVMAFGAPLAAHLPLTLNSSIRGFETCFVAVTPTVLADVTSVRFPLLVPIPNVPALRGVQVGLQTICRECGFAGCFELLTQGLGVTIG
ncbi:MAG: hypothetical protein R3F56_08150 [Planctomycetota bacterium]